MAAMLHPDAVASALYGRFVGRTDVLHIRIAAERGDPCTFAPYVRFVVRWQDTRGQDYGWSSAWDVGEWAMWQSTDGFAAMLHTSWCLAWQRAVGAATS